LARAYAGSSAVAGVIPAHAVAETYQQLALKVLPSVTRLPVIARVLLLLSTYDIGVCRWDMMQDRLAQAIEICQRIGDKRQLGDGQAILGLGLFYQSQFSASRAMYDRLCDTTTRSGDDQLRAWALIGQGKNALRLGRLDAALAFLEEGMALAAESADRRAEITSYGATATVRLRRGEYDLARQAADTAMRFIASSTRPTSRFLLEGYSGPAEVYLALWAQCTNNNTAALQQAARQACQALQRYARIFPFAQPRAWLWQGVYEWQAGRASKASKTWQKSLATAEKLNMPYDQALAHVQLSRHVSGSVQQAHLARDIFARLEATYDLDQLLAIS
jgi:tetratricopeptide (TPR) repeat protein